MLYSLSKRLIFPDAKNKENFYDEYYVGLLVYLIEK